MVARRVLPGIYRPSILRDESAGENKPAKATADDFPSLVSNVPSSRLHHDHVVCKTSTSRNVYQHCRGDSIKMEASTDRERVAYLYDLDYVSNCRVGVVLAFEQYVGFGHRRKLYPFQRHQLPYPILCLSHWHRHSK